AVTSSRFVKDRAGQAGSNYSSTRYQKINPVPIAGASVDGWLGGPVADTRYQFALKFIQTGPNAQFKRDTLQATFMPAYFWQGTGVRKVDGVIQPGTVHPDFGWAKNPDYFIPDTSVRAKYPASLVLRVPKVDEIVYRLYRNVQATVYALQAGALDFIDWTVPTDQVGPIAGDPNIGLKSSADAGFFYQSFNFDRLPFGYLNPALGSTGNNDVGRPFRLAVAYATNKRTIVTSLLQNFGVAGHTVVSPTNTLYYNASAPRYDFNPSVAAGILDPAAAASFYSSQGYGFDPPGDCLNDGPGCRHLPGDPPAGKPR